MLGPEAGLRCGDRVFCFLHIVCHITLTQILKSGKVHAEEGSCL